MGSGADRMHEGVNKAMLKKHLGDMVKDRKEKILKNMVFKYRNDTLDDKEARVMIGVFSELDGAVNDI